MRYITLLRLSRPAEQIGERYSIAACSLQDDQSICPQYHEAARQALAAEMAEAIHEQLQQHNLTAATFDRIDRITNLCDRIAFDVCFEAPAEGEVRIFPRNDRDEEIAVRYRTEDSMIQVAPWPFTVDSHTGYLVGYQLDGYPTVLEPLLLTYHLVRATRI
jgi:hypothetical protein